MNTTILKKESKFSYSELDVLFTEKLRLMQRDAALTAKYNLKAFDFAELNDLKTTFSTAVMDALMVEKNKESTFRKNKLNGILKTNILFIREAMLNAIGANELINIMPLMKHLSRFNDAELLQATRTVFRFTVENQAKLSDWGISEAFLTNLLKIIEEYSEKIDTALASKTNRKEATQERYELVNRVWTVLQQICAAGRMVWLMEGNGTMYAEYVLPKTRASKTDSKANETDIVS